MTLSRDPAFHLRGVTIIEVLVASLLVMMGLGGIFAINTRCLHLLRSTRQVAASSQMLQQRMETLREKPWPEVSNSTALAQLMRTPTESEKELADAGVVEAITVSVPPTVDAIAKDKVRAFTVLRQRGTTQIPDPGDLGAEPLLLVEIVLTWRGIQKDQQRRQRTMICRTGLTRSGIFGSTFGRPSLTTPGLTTPAPTTLTGGLGISP
jgi:hypothetical protein